MSGSHVGAHACHCHGSGPVSDSQYPAPGGAAMSEAKPFTRIATDAAGGSTFQDEEIPPRYSTGRHGHARRDDSRRVSGRVPP